MFSNTLRIIIYSRVFEFKKESEDEDEDDDKNINK